MKTETINVPKSFRSNLIDALLEIRLSLSAKKITSPTIMKSEFKKILDDTKERFTQVKDALDNVFDEYFPKAKNEVNAISFTAFPQIEKTEYEEAGAEKGVSLVKRDGHFNSSINNNQAA